MRSGPIIPGLGARRKGRASASPAARTPAPSIIPKARRDGLDEGMTPPPGSDSRGVLPRRVGEIHQRRQDNAMAAPPTISIARLADANVSSLAWTKAAI
jgi:hypothetical protein